MIVVTGATGNIGRPLVAALAEAGEDVVAVSRRPQASGLADGVRRAQADLADFASMAPVLEGADAFFILLAGELNGPGESANVLLDAAVAAGVGRVVLVSSQLAGTRPAGNASHSRLREFEAAVRGSGLDHTILRPGGFASNAFAWAESVRSDRTVLAPFGDVALPVVDPADIAAVAAVALREEGHFGQTYELTGPAAITPREQAAALAGVLGEEVAFIELTREAAAAHLSQFMPQDVVHGTLDVLGLPLPAEQRVGPDVEKVLGRPAAPFAAWARRNLPAFT
ncbi:SDR family oxidoreductase [Streptomyces sp. NBC_00503]|uniref:SDR family oxidoreductase n=1 Tax=Streptomyces sp. NBC_00503 TaxID=2903659 RepID=UPI002E816BCD|nr:NAD(P)H-binding protein [Streptomyces sp. NBC_00503]WUD86441.1 NAD(P)H-binding protein [Streptomyces sp. NBC_00503]